MKMSVPVVIKTEDIIVDNNEYNSDDIEDDLQLALQDPGGDSYNQRTSQPSSQRRNVLTIAQNSDSRVETLKNSLGPKNSLETEKRMRREIANSNERRRMQSINAGFQNLRALLPRHEGEKLSKAAILQQTSQYILDLEDEKTALLSQNSQLKRILGEQEGGGGSGEAPPPPPPSHGNTNNINCSGSANNNGLNPPPPNGGVAVKKRKLTDNVVTLHTISDSSDEGLGSMSPEPMTLLTNVGGNAATAAATATVIGLNKTSHANATAATYLASPQSPATAKDSIELKRELDKERRLRTLAEEELRLIKRQLYQTNYIPREVIEHTDNIVRDNEMSTMQYVEIDDVGGGGGGGGGNIGHQQVVVCSSIDDIPDEGSELISEDNLHEEVIISEESDIKYSDSSVLQPILQAAIKATPKVEVERINETMKIKTEKIDCNVTTNNNNTSSIGLTRSRQNLETIVEAIRHLEGDHLFGDVSDQQKHKIHITAQDAPLALTTKQQQQLQLQQQQQQQQHSTSSQHSLHPSTIPLQHQHQQEQQQQRKTIAELSPFLQIKNAKSVPNNLVTIVNGTSITLTPSSTVAATLGQISTNNINNINSNNNSSAKMLITTASSSLSSSSSSPPSLTSSSSLISVGTTLVASSNARTSNSGSVTNSICNKVQQQELQQQQHHNNHSVTPTAIVKVQSASNLLSPSQLTITATALKQCRPGVIVAKQVS